MRYLGHIIRPGSLEIDHVRKKALKDAQHPCTKAELRSFLRICNFYRRLVPQYAVIAAQLTELLYKETPDPLDGYGSIGSKAFDTLINCITEPPVLALPKAGAQFILDADVSDYQIGCA